MGGIRVPSQQIIPANAISVVKELGAVSKPLNLNPHLNCVCITLFSIQGEFGVVQQGVWTDENGKSVPGEERF